MAEVPAKQHWCDLYFGRGLDVIGRLITRETAGFRETDVIIAHVNPDLPDGPQIAKDIAAAINLKFTNQETPK